MNRFFSKLLGVPESCAICELDESLHKRNSSLIESVSGFFHDYKPNTFFGYYKELISWKWQNIKDTYFQKYWKHNLYVRHPWVKTIVTGKRQKRRHAEAEANLNNFRDTFNEVMPYTLGQGLTHELGECSSDCPVCKTEAGGK